MKSLTVVAGCLLWLTAAAAAQGPAGTYSFRLCQLECGEGPADPVATGHFVLFSDTLAFEAARSEAGVTFPREGPRFMRGAPNACFAVESSVRRVGGEELYVGIQTSAATRWVEQGALLSVRLYQSPDAWADLLGPAAGDTIRGINRQQHCCGRGILEVGHFEAIRTGPPDVSRCQLERSASERR